MSPLRILIIDDDPVDREIFKQYLEADALGEFVFAQEGTGKSGLSRLESFQPDCVLLDFNLPDIDGLNMIRRLCPDGKSPPCAIVMLTALGSERIAVEAMKLGVMDYVVKGPATSEALPRTVAAAVQRYQLQQQVVQQRLDLQQRNAELEAIRAELFAEKERYRTLTEAIPQLVWTSDSDGRIEYANQRLREFSGKTDLHGWPLRTLIYPEDSPALMEKWHEAVASRKAFESEIRLRRSQDQSWRWNLMRATPIQISDAEVKWFGTFTDLEDQKRSEEALRQRQKLDSIGLLAGGIAHDFNNLLVGIMGGASFALDSLEPGHPAQGMLEIVVRSSERAAHLTQQLLAYAGKDKTFPEPVDIHRIVHDTCELVRASVPRTVHLVDASDPDLPVIETNTAQMQQLVMNLIINAAEAIGEQSGYVHILTEVERVEAGAAPSNVLGYSVGPGEYVVIEVSDSGVGMDEKTQAQIFDPFFTTKFTGRGLGLAAVQGIVRSLGGAIQLHSAPGEGSTFRVLLPARRSHVEAVQVRTTHASLRTAVILLIDDEEVVRATARSALERAGHTVLEAGSGPEGLQIYRLEQGSIGLILLDLSMPEMSGTETLTHLREISPEVPVATLSGYSEQEISGRFGDLNVVDHIRKPFTAASLESSVNAILFAAEAERASATSSGDLNAREVRHGANT